MAYRWNPLPWKFDRVGGTGPGAGILTLSAQGGTPTSPLGNNFDFSGNTLGAILFSTPSDGLMKAQVQVDTTTIGINASNQLYVIGEKVFKVTTTGLQTVTLASIPVVANTVTTIEARISGFGTPSSGPLTSGVGGTIVATFLGTPAGNALLIGTADYFIQRFLSSTVNFIITQSGANIIIQVTGDTDYMIKWVGTTNITVAS